ncbi:MAG: hypothetical protein MZW92_35125 [Comamonadaceae bacterium]|nr:hypothetical protein [Comamonadaceae bacterium]
MPVGGSLAVRRSGRHDGGCDDFHPARRQAGAAHPGARVHGPGAARGLRAPGRDGASPTRARWTRTRPLPAAIVREPRAASTCCCCTWRCRRPARRAAEISDAEWRDVFAPPGRPDAPAGGRGRCRR